ncbi:heparinase II/III-family protein [Paenibacillus hunanensis]|uniref:heparinase II/III family protein n=1 Tax=Paenibacillus hunanensis TaxID=539262 RepID=UPI0020268FF4|nr:heparinase II/III family protein [Paenibacillus hunanensis]MCL9660298.1 heparinase II/III-family protein [Paenibacillus hunanensis]
MNSDLLHSIQPASLWRIEDIHTRLLITMQHPAYTDWWQDIEQYARRALVEGLPALRFELFRQFADEGQRIPYEQVYFDRRGKVGSLAIMLLRLQAECQQHEHADTDSTRQVVEQGLQTRHIQQQQKKQQQRQEQQNHLLKLDINEVRVALEEALWDLCGEYTWCLPAHLPALANTPAWQEIDLFTAETAGMLAELCILLDGSIDPRIIQRMQLEIRRRVLDVLVDSERHFGWETAEHNWAAVCANGCGIAALLVEQHGGRRQRILKRVLQALDYFLKGYGEDGGCGEGIGYWVYGFGYFTYLIDMLEAAGNPVQLSEAQHRKIQAIAAFPQAAHLSGGVFVNFSDSEEWPTLPAGLLSRLAERQGISISLPFEMPLFSQDHCHRWAHMLRDLLWSKPERWGVNDANPTDHVESRVSSSHYWRDLEWLVVPGKVGFAAKGGHNDEPHNHNDLGSFIIHGGGQNLLCDPGAGMYTQAYFAPGREAILHISSAGHSLPRINGMEQQSGREQAAVVLELEQKAQETVFMLELAAAYPPAAGLNSFTRRFHWQSLPTAEAATRMAKLEVQDRFIFKQDEAISGDNIEINERFMSRIKPQIGDDGIIWQGEQALVRLDIVKGQYDICTEELASYDHEGQPITLYRTNVVLIQSRQALAARQELGAMHHIADENQDRGMHCLFTFTVIAHESLND